MDILRNIYDIYLRSGRVTTDTRSLKKDDIFIALKGANFNGNKFARQAIDLGASAVVVDEDVDLTSHKVFRVENGLEFLQDLARYHRMQLRIPVIGITGSNGKTTTKELMNAVLETRFKAFATRGNFNNHIGVPLTLLEIGKTIEIAIVEMGANHMKEIEFLCEIARPTLGYITNFGKAHLEGFGSEANIVKGKSELYRFIEQSGGTVLLDARDPVQLRQSGTAQKILFGDQPEDDIFITNHSDTENLEIGYQGELIRPRITGKYNLKNISAAIAVGAHFGVPPKNIKKAIEDYVPSMNRSEIKETGKNTLMLDAYNANPSSMKASIESFDKQFKTGKFVLLGDMFELGKQTGKEHQMICDLLKDMDVQEVVLVGKAFYKCKIPKTWNRFKTTIEAEEFLRDAKVQNKNILIKGSRGMHLETTTKYL